MSQSAGSKGTAADKSLGNRRADMRHACRVRSLFSTSRPRDEAQVETRWNMARIADVSKRGIALVVQHAYDPGTILFVEPLVRPWDATQELEARVTNVRPESEGWWCVGCRLNRSLSSEELKIFLETVG
jgi:hypothetical protein